MFAIIPKPVHIQPGDGVFQLSPDTTIIFEPNTSDLESIGSYLAGILRRSTGYVIPLTSPVNRPALSVIELRIDKESEWGEEGYELSITPTSVNLTAREPAGLFRGAQTIRQLLPATIERSAIQSGPWPMPTGVIRDYPRYPWRGLMLDVARHFFPVEEVKRYIDLAAAYKLNRLHLHLTDDQGWRIEIKSWPDLARIGGSTAVGGAEGGFYTQEAYAELVAYAQDRYITLIPEIDMPGHTHAALAAYPELNCDGIAPPLYTGTKVGFSSLCTTKSITYEFIRDVVREIAALTPGPYIHIGGDEALATDPALYAAFITEVQAIVREHDKTMIGWEEIGQVALDTGTIVQHWASGQAVAAANKGAKVIMSPATKTYLDMKYDKDSPLGLDWAGFVNVESAYHWDPARQLPNLDEAAILGLEGCLWTETMATAADREFMLLPRLPGLAEIAWSPSDGRDWAEFRNRLSHHSRRWTMMGQNYHRSPELDWK